MDNHKYCYGKIQDIIYDSECLIQSIPIAIGGPHHIDNEKNSYKELTTHSKLKSINISNTTSLSPIIDTNEYPITQKIILSNCTSIQPYHLILFFDQKDNTYKLRVLAQCYISGKEYSTNSIIQINSYDNIAINCQECRSDHIYIITLSQRTNNSIQMLSTFGDANKNLCRSDTNQNDSNKKFIGLKEPNKKPDEDLAKKWTNHERECLQKYLVTFGYDRWDIIKDNSEKVLSEKKDLELKVFSLAFIKKIIELLPQDKKGELQSFLINFVHANENEDEPYIDYKREDWGNLINQKAPAWGKRIQLLHKVKLIVETFAKENKKNNELREALHDENIDVSQKEQFNNEIKSTYDDWNNLLDFLPDSALCGQKPANWWTKSHDIDLLRGTYKHGYANYSSMKKDNELSFGKLEGSSLHDFPNPDTITRRLKRLIQIIIRKENENENESEENKSKETSGFSLEEKNKIITYLINYGIPINNSGKNDWSALKMKLIEKQIIPKDVKDNKENGEGRTITTQMLEIFTQKLQNLSQQIKDKGYTEIDSTIKTKLNTDNDGFVITLEQARNITTNISLMEFIRQNIQNISSQKSLFDQGLKELNELTKSGKTEPEKCKEEYWKCSLHDKSLLSCVEKKGFNYINKDIQSDRLFEKIPFTKDDYFTRINFLCQFYSNIKYNRKPNQPPPIRKNKEIRIVSGKKKIKVELDENNNFIYPIEVSTSLTIWNLGKIEYSKPQYHTENNLFPIGYKVTREAQSMTKKGEKAIYTCEILDNGDKPKYRIVCNDNPNEPIEENSSTGCWKVVAERINELNDKKRPKVTISGTERFGLCDNIVVQLMQMLPDAEKCDKYIFKKNDKFNE